MKLQLLITILVVTFAGSEDEGRFDQYFAFKYDISVEIDEQIGIVGSFDTYKNKILITDPVGNQVLLYDTKQKQGTFLDPESCHPGYKMMPVQTLFKPDGNIFMVNSYLWGFNFKADGSCEGVFNERKIATNNLNFDNDANYISFNLNDNTVYVINEEKKIVNTYEIDFHSDNLLNKKFLGGGLVTTEKAIYTAVPSSPAITKIDKVDDSIERWELDISNLNYPEKKLMTTNKQDLLSKFSEVVKDKDLTESLALLNDSTLVLQTVVNNEQRKVILISTDGTVITDKALTIPNNEIFLGAQKNYLYTYNYQEYQNNPEVNIPPVKVYRYLK